MSIATRPCGRNPSRSCESVRKLSTNTLDTINSANVSAICPTIVASKRRCVLRPSLARAELEMSRTTSVRDARKAGIAPASRPVSVTRHATNVSTGSRARERLSLPAPRASSGRRRPGREADPRRELTADGRPVGPDREARTDLLAPGDRACKEDVAEVGTGG